MGRPQSLGILRQASRRVSWVGTVCTSAASSEPAAQRSPRCPKAILKVFPEVCSESVSECYRKGRSEGAS